MRCISNDCARVDAVYRTLARSNKGQGLGFKVFGQVLDRSKLRRFALGVYAFLVTVVPLLVAATHNHPALAPMESVEAGTCELTRGQRDLLRATFAQLNATMDMLRAKRHRRGPVVVNAQSISYTQRRRTYR